MKTDALKFAIGLRQAGLNSHEIENELEDYALTPEQIQIVLQESDHYWLEELIRQSKSKRRSFRFLGKTVWLWLGIVFLYPQFTGEIQASFILLILLWGAYRRSRILGYQYIDPGKFSWFGN